MKHPIIYRVEFIAEGERRSVAFKVRQLARKYFMMIRHDKGLSECVLLKVELLEKN